MLTTAVPGTKRVGVLWDPNFPSDGPQLTEIETAAPILHLELVPMEVRGPDDFQLSLQTMAEQHADGVIVLPAPIFDANSQRITELATRARLPRIFQRRNWLKPVA